MYACIHRRILAFLVDVSIIYALPFALKLLGVIDNKISTVLVFAAFISWFYFFVTLSVFKGRTFGSNLLGIQVVSSDLNKLTVKKIIIRTILLTILTAPIGVVLVAFIFNIVASIGTLNTLPWKTKKQTFWDFASDTCVINAKQIEYKGTNESK